MTEDAAMTDEQERCAYLVPDHGKCGYPKARHQAITTWLDADLDDELPVPGWDWHPFVPPQPADEQQTERRIADAWDEYDSKRWDFNGDMTSEQVAVRTAIEAPLKGQIARLEADAAIERANYQTLGENWAAAEAQVKALEERLAAKEL